MVAEIRQDNLDMVAAGVTYYAVLAVAPALVALVSLYGLFAAPEDLALVLEPLFELVPPGAGRDLIVELLDRAVETRPSSLTFKAVIALALSLWSANRGTKALVAAVGLAYEQEERPGILRENFKSLVFLIGGIGVLAASALTFVELPEQLTGSLIGNGLARALYWARWPATFLAILFGLSALYRWGPERRQARWRWVSLGSVVATLLWLAVGYALSLYVEVVGEARTGHEALDAVIGLLLWFYATSWAILLGAELNAEVEHQTMRDSTIGVPRPMGKRGAYVADHLGPTRREHRLERKAQRKLQREARSGDDDVVDEVEEAVDAARVEAASSGSTCTAQAV
nr:YihY/virulence factor BrkB family protein [Pseudenhygromyxa sp. WMMC2535]